MDELVSLLSNRADTSNDSQIIQYTVSSIDRLISDWTYAAGTSNHGKYGTYTLAWVTTLELPEFPRDVASQISRRIIEQEAKVIYRALTLMRQAQTIPTISLLKQFARYAPIDLCNEFDFTLRIIPKLLTQQPYRTAFLELYLLLIEQAPATVRRELLANRKIFSGWFSKLGIEDEASLLERTFEVLREKVLKNVSVFTKTMKMGIFNDWTLKNLQRLLSSTALSDKVVELVQQFISILLSDRTYGVRLPGENKLALSFLKIVKPWENKSQMDMVLRLLTQMPELVVPCFDNLAVAYPLTPKLSMWWFSYSVLHIRVLKLDGVPHLDGAFSTGLESMARSILPITVTRTALLQALSNKESSLIPFQAAQIVLFALRRLQRVTNTLNSHGSWDPNPLIENVLSRLPEPSAFATTVTPALLQTTYLLVLREYCSLRPLSVNLALPLDPEQLHGLRLIEAEQILEVQTYTSDQTKWWQPAKGQLSLFTQLTKFSTLNVPLAEKSSQLLQHLVQPTQVFADIATLSHPLDAFLATLHSTYQSNHEALSTVWSLLEETIQRVVRSPYQYIDNVKSYRVSPFLVALLEQYTQHFVHKDKFERFTKAWIAAFARSLIVLGEEEKLIAKRIAELGATDSGLGRDEYFNFVLDTSDSELLRRQDLILKISNKLELSATLYRAAHTSNAEVRNHLLASVPADMLPVLAENPAAFTPFIYGSSDLCKIFLTVLDGTSSAALCASLESSSNWLSALNLLSTEFLVSRIALREEDSLTKLGVLRELNSRGVTVPPDAIRGLVGLEDLIENLNLREPGSLKAEEGPWAHIIRETDDPRLVAAFVRATGHYDPLAPQSSHPLVIEAGILYSASEVDDSKALTVAATALADETDSAAAISILAALKDPQSVLREGSELCESVEAYIEDAKRLWGTALTTSFLQLARLEPPFLSRWLKVAVHQLTKCYAEKRMSPRIEDFIREFVADNKMSRLLWHHVHPNAINALVEAALRSAEHLVDASGLVSQITLSGREKAQGGGIGGSGSSHGGARSAGDRDGSVTSRFSTAGHLNLLLERSRRESLGLESAVAVYALVTFDPVVCATLEVEHGVLQQYEGTISAKDRVLLQVLEIIESERQRSWVDSVANWDVRPAHSASLDEVDDYGKEPLFVVKGGHSVYVTLDEERIRRTAQSCEVVDSWAIKPELECFAEICTSTSAYTDTIPHSPERLYDSEFLLGCLVSCDSVLQNVELMLVSGLLSFAISALSSPNLYETAIRLLTHIFGLLIEQEQHQHEEQHEEQHQAHNQHQRQKQHKQQPQQPQQQQARAKDQLSVRLLLGKLLKLDASQRTNGVRIPSHVPGMVAQIALVLARPNHYLYDKACQWLLSTPDIAAFDVPLFRVIVGGQGEQKTREMLWAINTVKSGAVDQQAVQFLVSKGVIEWCVSQHSALGHRSNALVEAVRRLVERIEEVRAGAATLIRRSGGLATPDFKQDLVRAAGPGLVTEWTGQANWAAAMPAQPARALLPISRAFEAMRLTCALIRQVEAPSL